MAEERRISADVYDKLSNDCKIMLYNQALLNKGGAFTYRKGDKYILSQSTDIRFSGSYGVIEQRLLTYDISVSDCFIGLAVTILGTADLVGIMDVLRWLKEKYPEKVIPSTITLATLKDRLVKMSRAGIIRHFTIANDDNKRGSLFCTSELGARAIKRRLDMDFLSYDTWPLIDCEHRMYKRLIENKIGCALLPYNKREPAKFYSEIYDKAKGVRVPIYVRQEIPYKKDGIEKLAYIVVEPVSFNVDSIIKTESEVEDDVRNKLNAVFTKIDIAKGTQSLGTDTKEKKYDEAFAIIVVDDMACLNRVLRIIVSGSITNLSKCYFTTEMILSKHKGKFLRSLIKVDAADLSKVRMNIDMDLQEIFGEDNLSDIPDSFKEMIFAEGD